MARTPMRTDLLSLSVPVNADNIDRAMTAIEIEGQIKMISGALRGPLSNVERGSLVADRRELRERLAQLEGE